MDGFHDQAYLLQSQYKDEKKYSARVDLGRRFGVNPYGFNLWVFDHIQIPEYSRVLELGCGPGLLWRGNLQRIPASWQITLTDFSPGMLDSARQRLGEERFTYQVADAQAIPFADASFDTVIANHMLYHIPDLPRALGEIRRVLKPTGRFYATTIGREHMRELPALFAARQSAQNKRWKTIGEVASFVLENGQELLTPFFPQITLDRYPDALEVTEAEPLAAYIFSGRLGTSLSEQARESLLTSIRQELDRRGGSIHLTKASGLFAASA
jgi:ubiquinone/menaquinone biosynthesis C-methylase UbiE